MSKNQEQDDKAAAGEMRSAERSKKFFGDEPLEADPESPLDITIEDLHTPVSRMAPPDEIHAS